MALYGQKGVILVDFTPRNKTISAAEYDATLKKLCRNIFEKGRSLCSDGVILQRDNSRLHSALVSQESFSWPDLL